MPPICYLLVELSSAGLSVFRVWASGDIPNGSDFQLLFDHATIAIRDFKRLDAAQKIEVFAYKVFHLDLTISFPAQLYSARQTDSDFCKVAYEN